MFIFPRLVESIICGHQLNSIACLTFNMANCKNVNFYIKRYKCESQKKSFNIPPVTEMPVIPKCVILICSLKSCFQNQSPIITFHFLSAMRAS